MASKLEKAREDLEDYYNIRGDMLVDAVIEAARADGECEFLKYGKEQFDAGVVLGKAQSRAARGTCATCNHWRRTTEYRAIVASKFGQCSKLDLHATLEDFGCTAHEPREEADDD